MKTSSFKKTGSKNDFTSWFVHNITPEIAKHLSERQAWRDRALTHRGPAQDGDIKSGDIIKEINRKPIKNIEI
jgi:C-terminal processing protease CtpA/Prc